MPSPKRKPAPTVSWTTLPYESMTTAQQAGYDIQSERPDLEPSVRRILDAELADDDKAAAMERFRHALTNPGDPNRDPRHAILPA